MQFIPYLIFQCDEFDALALVCETIVVKFTAEIESDSYFYVEYSKIYHFVVSLELYHALYVPMNGFLFEIFVANHMRVLEYY